MIIFLMVLFQAALVSSAFSQVVINEVDADTPGTDTAEFVELFGPSGTDLSGLVLVFFNGSDAASYNVFDLDGFSLDATGFFVLCSNTANVMNCDSDGLLDNGIQNGADAVALCSGNATDFPDDTPVTATNLIDALVCDTDDGDDAGLLDVLTPGQPQINERGRGPLTPGPPE